MIDHLPKLYDVPALADYLGVSAWSVRNEIKKGRLQSIKIGREYRVTETALREYLEAAWQTKNNSGSDDTGSSGLGRSGTSTGTTQAKEKRDADQLAKQIFG